MYMVRKTAKGRVTTRFKQPLLRPTFIKQWRKHRGLSLEALAERVGAHLEGGFTHASLSRIENRKQPYSQPVLEALAVELQTDPASLLMRDPTDPDAIWSIWDNAKEGQKKVIRNLAETVVKTGT